MFFVFFLDTFAILVIEALVILNHLTRIYYRPEIKKLNPELEEISQNYEFRYRCKVAIIGRKKDHTYAFVD